MVWSICFQKQMDQTREKHEHGTDRGHAKDTGSLKDLESLDLLIGVGKRGLLEKVFSENEVFRDYRESPECENGCCTHCQDLPEILEILETPSVKGALW